MRLFIPITTAVLRRGLLTTVIVLLTACDAGGSDTPQVCREHVSTLAVTRATYRLNVLKAAAQRAGEGDEYEVVTKVGRFTNANVENALALATDELQIAQAELDGKLRNCGGN